MRSRTISVMAVTVVVMDAIIRRQRWHACVSAKLCLDVGGLDVSGCGVHRWQRPRQLSVTAVLVRRQQRRLSWWRCGQRSGGSLDVLCWQRRACVACTCVRWHPVAAAAAAAACGNGKRAWTAAQLCCDGGGGVVRGRRAAVGGNGMPRQRWWRRAQVLGSGRRRRFAVKAVAAA